MSFSKFLLLLISLLLSFNFICQSIQIGHTTSLFYDSSRNRNIETEIYYPAISSGDNEPIAIGSFPVIIFGHGFLMDWESYQNVWDQLVPNGYIICFPTTEMGISPNHQNFGEDLKYLANRMQQENGNTNSILYNSINSSTCLMGHSMGGGASFLAASNNPNISTLINFAAAETSPSAIAASNNISASTLIFSGQDDCVTPPADHQNLMFSGLNTNCKVQIEIIDGVHCYFANENLNCSFGESFCNPNITITREYQQSVMNDFVTPWLDFTLKQDSNALLSFNDSLQFSNRINHSKNCNQLGNSNLDNNFDFNIYPNPIIDKLNLITPSNSVNGTLKIYNLFGSLLKEEIIIKAETKINFSDYPNGSYILVFKSKFNNKTVKAIKFNH